MIAPRSGTVSRMLSVHMFSNCNAENMITHAESAVLAINRNFSDADINTHFGLTCIPPIEQLTDDGSAKWHERELRHLEALFSKRNPDDCDTENQPVYGSSYSKRYAADDQPNDVGQKRYRTAAILNIFSERKKGERRKFEALHSDRDANNRDAPEATGKCP